MENKGFWFGNERMYLVYPKIEIESTLVDGKYVRVGQHDAIINNPTYIIDKNNMNFEEQKLFIIGKAKYYEFNKK